MAAVIIVQARIDSNRLKGKVIKKINGLPLIYYLLKRLALTRLKIVLAVPFLDEKVFRDVLKSFPQIELFLGPESNVLKRYYLAAQKFPANHYVRVTADNPFTSVFCLLTILKEHEAGNYDYSHFEELPLGTGVEVLRKATLADLYEKTTLKEDLEHVTGYLRRNLNQYRVLIKPAPFSYRHADFRLTVDDEKDFLRTEKIIKSYPAKIVPLNHIINNYFHFLK